MLNNKKKLVLKMKGARMLEQYILINYFVSVNHMVGYLEAQTNCQTKSELQAIRADLILLTAEIFAKKAQSTGV